MSEDTATRSLSQMTEITHLRSFIDLTWGEQAETEVK